jgi:hypothetical protein
MSQPQRKTPKKAAQRATELPDDQAIRKLFPAKVVKKANKEIDHEPTKKKAKGE